MSTNNTNGRIEAEISIENFDSEDSDEKLEIVFNRKRDLPCQELINQEFSNQEPLIIENNNDIDTNNEYTDENGRMAVEFNVNLMPLRTSQLENDAGFQTEEEVTTSIQEASDTINSRIDHEVETLNTEINKKVEIITGDDFINITRSDSTVIINSKTFIFEQAIASNTWVINYDWSLKKPTISIIDSAGNVQLPNDINYTSNTITLSFLAAFTGKAYLN